MLFFPSHIKKSLVLLARLAAALSRTIRLGVQLPITAHTSAAGSVLSGAGAGGNRTNHCFTSMFLSLCVSLLFSPSPTSFLS